MFTKQPPITVNVPVKIFHNKEDMEVGIFYSQFPLGQLYKWHSVVAPSSEVIWQCTEVTTNLSDLIELSYDQITSELYNALKIFYIGKEPKPIFRHQNDIRDTY
jgi:hypothetical protein